MTKEMVMEKTSEIISQYLRLNEGEIQPDSHIMNDLGADSLALVELGFKISDEFGIGMLTPGEDLMVIENLVSHITSTMGN